MPASLESIGVSAQPDNLSEVELRLLCLCARVNLTIDDRRQVEELAGGKIDWQLTFKLARRHCCLALLHRHLKAVCPDSAPPDLMQSIQESCQAIALHNLTLASDLIKLVKQFERERIDSIPYKGPVLTQLAYGGLSLREFDDLDILVRPHDLIGARQVLLDAGFKSGLHENLSGFFVENSCHHLFVDPRRQYYVELHWAVAPSYFPMAFKGQRLWQHLRRIPFGGLSVLGHKVEDLVLVLGIHGAKHHWSRLSWIVDLAELIRRNPDLDWDSLLTEATRLHCRRIVALGAHLAAEILDAPVPSRIRELIARDAVMVKLADEIWEGIRSPEELSWAGLKNVAYTCRVRERLRDRVVYIVRRAITPTEYEMNWQSLPRPLHFLYFPLRLLRMTFQHGGAISRRVLKSKKNGSGSPTVTVD